MRVVRHSGQRWRDARVAGDGDTHRVLEGAVVGVALRVGGQFDVPCQWVCFVLLAVVVRAVEHGVLERAALPDHVDGGGWRVRWDWFVDRP